MEKNESHNEKIEFSFSRNLDFYWKFISVYAIAIIIYALLKGSIDEWTVTVVLLDPVVILLSVFILLTALGLVFESSKKQEIIIGEDYIIFRNRFRQRKFLLEDIKKIFIGRERAKYSGKFRIIKIKLYNRKRPIIIRPSSYRNENELVNSFVSIRQKINR